MPVNYPGTTITKSSIATNPKKETILDVVKAFDNIPLSGDFTPLISHSILRSADVYNPYDPNDFDRDAGRKRHFQGVVRSLDGKFLFISGGDHTHNPKVAQIFVCSLEVNSGSQKSELGIEPMTINSTVGVLTEIFVVDCGRFWHNGGISSFGNVLILPLESDGYLPKQKMKTAESVIKFYDVTSPLKPTHLGIDIIREGTNAGTASIVRLENGYYLCAVWTDSDPTPGEAIDFYISNSTNLKDGFFSSERRYFHSKAHHRMRPKYQSIKLILQDDGELFMIGTDNSWALSPIPSWKGKNRARLYKINFNRSHAKPSAFSSFTPSMEVIRGTDDTIFKSGGNRYNFNGAAGIYITPEKTLALYASHHRTYDDGNVIPCTEFYPGFLKTNITTLKDSLIELYEDKNFKGRCLRIRGYHQNSAITDYKMLFVEDKHFDDKVSSIRFQLPKDKKYFLYQDKNFRGESIELIGTGKLVELDNIHSRSVKKKRGVYLIPKKMGDKVSSSKWE